MRPLVVLTGPTAVGKTSLSIALAKAINGEIISADSMQVYRHMNIGSAKITPEEMAGVKHYLIDVLEPHEEFNVTVFQRLCNQAMEEIYSKGKIPILVGGTGFYIQAVLYDVAFSDDEDNSEYRSKYESFAKTPEGVHALHERLKEVDPVSAKMIHENNVKRTIRALEYFEINGKPISEHNAIERQKDSAYRSYYFVLDDVREHLYERIEQRVDEMVQNGLLQEIESLKNMGYTKDMVSMQGIGYKEILAYLDGECSLEEAIQKIKLNTRHFAKRQLTWFRREKNVLWVPKQEYQYDEDKILEYMVNTIQNGEQNA